VFLAALPNGSPTDGPARAHYNGKLERPTIWAGAATTPEAAIQRQRDRVPAAATPDLRACWDFSIGTGGDTAADSGPASAHARLIGLPTRAMTGANWTGEVHDWKRAPDQYGAIHFHDDDQGNLGWPESFALRVPSDWPSGFYSAHIRSATGEDYLPFFVRPAVPRARVAFLVPTFTYQVYGCFVRPGRGAEIRDRAGAWNALPETPDMNPQFGLSTYNHHSDGSGVSLTSMRRPMLDTRPRQMSLMDPAERGSGTGRICSDSYIVDWLDRIGVDCDIVTDHDLHDEAEALLAPYSVVIAGQHPEYYSERMMQSMEAYLAGGGRLMYLGGNGFYWRAEPSREQPHAIEVRRAEGGIRVWAAEAGEYYLAYGGGYGGLWRRIGRPAHRLVGNGFSVQGKHLGFPYCFTDAIRDPRVAFMTAGYNAVPGAQFGETGFMGGGAAGFELDSADAHWGTPPNALIVAKGVVIHDEYVAVNEDIMATKHPKPREDWSCADMVFFETPSGGAVFSVGSMTYVGSIPANGYKNTVAQLTENVLRRFLETTPFS
jgi:N,N-dimethylformamidase